MFRIWLAIFNAISRFDFAIAERLGASAAITTPFFLFWLFPFVLVILPGKPFEIAGIGIALFYIFILIGDNVIGRDLMCEVVLKSPTISRRHANLRVSFDQKRFTIEDLGSTNGVRLGSLVLKKEKREIDADAEIRIGEITLKLLALDEDDESTRGVSVAKS